MDLSPTDKALFDAIAQGTESAVKTALKTANVNATSMWDGTPLHRAARAGNTAIIKLLLDKGAKLETKDATDMTPLMTAAVEGQIAAAMYLLEKGAKVTDDIVMTLSQKIRILEENADEGMVKPESVIAWKAFLAKLTKTRP